MPAHICFFMLNSPDLTPGFTAPVRVAMLRKLKRLSPGEHWSKGRQPRPHLRQG
jgi:hypothetical protein